MDNFVELKKMLGNKFNIIISAAILVTSVYYLWKKLKIRKSKMNDNVQIKESQEIVNDTNIYVSENFTEFSDDNDVFSTPFKVNVCDDYVIDKSVSDDTTYNTSLYMSIDNINTTFDQSFTSELCKDFRDMRLSSSVINIENNELVEEVMHENKIISNFLFIKNISKESDIESVANNQINFKTPDMQVELNNDSNITIIEERNHLKRTPEVEENEDIVKVTEFLNTKYINNVSLSVTSSEMEDMYKSDIKENKLGNIKVINVEDSVILEDFEKKEEKIITYLEPTENEIIPFEKGKILEDLISKNNREDNREKKVTIDEDCNDVVEKGEIFDDSISKYIEVNIEEDTRLKDTEEEVPLNEQSDVESISDDVIIENGILVDSISENIHENEKEIKLGGHSNDLIDVGEILEDTISEDIKVNMKEEKLTLDEQCNAEVIADDVIEEVEILEDREDGEVKLDRYSKDVIEEGEILEDTISEDIEVEKEEMITHLKYTEDKVTLDEQLQAEVNVDGVIEEGEILEDSISENIHKNVEDEKEKEVKLEGHSNGVILEDTFTEDIEVYVEEEEMITHLKEVEEQLTQDEKSYVESITDDVIEEEEILEALEKQEEIPNSEKEIIDHGNQFQCGQIINSEDSKNEMRLEMDTISERLDNDNYVGDEILKSVIITNNEVNIFEVKELKNIQHSEEVINTLSSNDVLTTQESVDAKECDDDIYTKEETTEEKVIEDEVMNETIEDFDNSEHSSTEVSINNDSVIEDEDSLDCLINNIDQYFKKSSSDRSNATAKENNSENWQNDEDYLDNIKRDFYDLKETVCSPHPSSESDHAHCVNNLTERVATHSAESILDNLLILNINQTDSRITPTLSSPIYDDSCPELYVEKINFHGKEMDIVYFDESLLEECGVISDARIVRTIPVGISGRIIGKKGKTKNELLKKFGAELLIYNHPSEHCKQVLQITCTPAFKEQLEKWVDKTLEQILKNTIQTTVSNPEWLKPMVPIGKMVLVQIVDMPTIQHIKLRLYDPKTIKAYNKMQAEINLDYSKADANALLPSPVAVGCICIAMIRPDYFLRAQIICIYDQYAIVYLYDLGKTHQTCLFYLFKIREKYMQVPFQVIPGRMPHAVMKNNLFTSAMIHKRFLCDQKTLRPQTVRAFFPRMNTCCEPCVHLYVSRAPLDHSETSEEDCVDLLELLVSIDVCTMVKETIDCDLQQKMNDDNFKHFLTEKEKKQVLTTPVYFEPCNMGFYEDFLDFQYNVDNIKV